MQSPTPRNVSQFWICEHFNFQLRAVLVCAESNFSRISPQKRTFKQNHFSLFIRGPDGFDSWNKKKCQKSRDTAPLKCYISTPYTTVLYTYNKIFSLKRCRAKTFFYLIKGVKEVKILWLGTVILCLHPAHLRAYLCVRPPALAIAGPWKKDKVVRCKKVYTLTEKNCRKLKFQRIFTHGVEWNSYIT